MLISTKDWGNTMLGGGRGYILNASSHNYYCTILARLAHTGNRRFAWLYNSWPHGLVLHFSHGHGRKKIFFVAFLSDWVFIHGEASSAFCFLSASVLFLGGPSFWIPAFMRSPMGWG